MFPVLLDFPDLTKLIFFFNKWGKKTPKPILFPSMIYGMISSLGMRALSFCRVCSIYCGCRVGLVWSWWQSGGRGRSQRGMGGDSYGDSEAAHIQEGTGHSPGTLTQRWSDMPTGRVRKGERRTGAFHGVRSLWYDFCDITIKTVGVMWTLATNRLRWRRPESWVCPGGVCPDLATN